MAELTADEFWFIQVYFERRGFYASYDITATKMTMYRLSFNGVDQAIKSLIAKNVLSPSPDGRKIKFTDYGIELYRSMANAQKDWDAKPIINISNIAHDEILIRAGETFRSNQVLREIFSCALKKLCILDPYVGDALFDLLADAAQRVSIRIIGSDKTKPATIRTTYKAFKNQYINVGFRIVPAAKLHDRFILWDGTAGFHLGHSIKDLGTKDTRLSRLANVSEQWKLFEERWKEGDPVQLS